MVDVSVLTPSFGYGRFIRDNALSVMKQEGVTVEHMVQDDGSQDDTLQVLGELRGFVDFRSEPDKGQSDALNKALQRATRRWIGWLNADEFYLPGALSTLAEAGDRLGADVVFGDSVDVDGEGRLLRLSPQHPFSERILRLYGPFISTAAVIFRRTKMPEVPWDQDLRLIMDWDLYLKLMKGGSKFRYVKRPLGAFRMHGDQESAHHKSMETAEVRKRYGIPRPMRYRKAGRLLHFVYKLSSGAYGRQKRAEALAGGDPTVVSR